MAHIQTVQQMYEAFGRGDIPAILERLAADVEWEYGANSSDVPWLQPRRGREDVGRFFDSLAALDIRKFQPKAFFQTGNQVVVLIDFEAIVRSTGLSVVEEDEVHIWHFDAQGQVSRFRHRVDTHQQWNARRSPEDA